jgi:fructose-bisphosphate aldolase class II
MPLVSLVPLLREAQNGGYAVPGFNVQSLEMLQGAVQAAEAERSPVILQFNPGNIAHVGMEYAAAMALAAARLACVPVAVHLDHGVDFDQTVRAVRLGFSSLMYDGTPFPFAQNLALTVQVCEMARAAGLSVEGEIGQMGGVEEGVFTAEGAGTMTDPDEAERYVQETGVDALAVAVGNVHGQTEATGRLDLDRLAAIRKRVEVPLVIHGGSGLPEDVVRAAIGLGVCKFNVATQLNLAYLKAFQEAAPGLANPRAALQAAREAVAEAARSRIRVYGSNGKGG